MRFAVSLLTVLGIASIIGTVLKQNEPYANYVVEFGQFWFGVFEGLGLYDVYHAAWFLLILLFLVLSTSLCILRNTPGMLRELRSFREHAQEASLRAFAHQAEFATVRPLEDNLTRLQAFLTAHGYRFRQRAHASGSVLLAAKIGSMQRIGYILTHAAIVIICLGGLMDGNVPFKLQELWGGKKIETRDIPESEVPAVSRLSVANLSFRANLQLPEGAQANTAFVRMRDGYLVQELPFALALERFRIEHYPTGQPKSFESDVEIVDPDLKTPLKATIRVNHPLTYKGITIYQSDFQDGGSALKFNAWPLRGGAAKPLPLQGKVFESLVLGEGAQALTLELNDFRFFNILTLESGAKAKPHNVGPSVSFKLRDAQGQAREYLNYMQPLLLDGRRYFVSGMRAAQNQDFRYLRIPADADDSIDDYMRLRAALFDPALAPRIAQRMAASALSREAAQQDLKQRFEESVAHLLGAFAQGGYTRIAEFIEQSVPKDEREKAAQTYIKIINNAAFEALVMAREQAGKSTPKPDEATLGFVHESLNSMSDLFFYETPFYLQLTDFQQRQASGFQLTRSPGKNVVYAGSLLLVLGIFAMIYLRERRIWLWVKPQSVLFAMAAGRKSRDFEIEFSRCRDQLRRTLEG